MTCNNCGGPTHELSVEKITLNTVHLVERKRMCLKCAEKFTTLEVPTKHINIEGWNLINQSTMKVRI